ncbi:MAG: glutamine-hydrolyzing carbamoyl-phosphate synthase small subunit [Rhodospirillales bacterium]
MSGSAPPGTDTETRPTEPPPPGADAALVLADGTVFWGRGVGAPTAPGGAQMGLKAGEVCFNTSMTGYQEIATDPSYAGQIIAFTFPHIGNTGANAEDIETTTPAALGCVFRECVTEPSNWRAAQHWSAWLKAHGLPAVTGVDTRALTHRIRDGGAPSGCIIYTPGETPDINAALKTARAFPGLEGMDLAKDVSCRQTYEWDETPWALGQGYGRLGDAGAGAAKRHIVAVDFGAKRNILRCLAGLGCRVTVVPAWAAAEDVLGHKPDGVFLSNGPGDPAATGAYAAEMVKGVLDAGAPIFGVCLGHQILALAAGAKTYKMAMGHRGANQPVQDLETGKVEITSQNHGFAVARESLPAGVVETHRSLFDGVVEGVKLTGAGQRAFSVQYHPEASPGPQDSHYLFKRFVEMVDGKAGGGE